MNPLATSQIDPRGLYQQADIARITGTNYSTVYRWLRSGKLAFSIRRGDNRPVVRGRHLIQFLNPKY
jgi:transposase